MSKVNEHFNETEYKNNAIELDVKVNTKELNDAIDKAEELNDLLTKIKINKIENLYITINHFKE